MAFWNWCPFRRPRRLNSSENEETHRSSETPHHELQQVGGEKIEVSRVAYQPIPATADSSPERRNKPHKLATDGVIKRSGKSSGNKFNRFSLPPQPRSHSSSALGDIPEEESAYVKSNPALNDPDSVDFDNFDNLSFHTAGSRMPSSRDLHSSLHLHDQEIRNLTEKLEEGMEKAEQERKSQHDKLKDMISDLAKKLDQERKKHHDELKGMIFDLTKKVESLEKEPVSPNITVEPQIPISADVKMNSSMLPQSSTVSTDVMLGLATIAMPKWKFLARYLHLQESEIQQISAENPSNVQEQTYQMLIKWNQSQTQNNDHYHILGEAVRRALGEKSYVDYIKMVVDVEGILSSQ